MMTVQCMSSLIKSMNEIVFFVCVFFGEGSLMFSLSDEYDGVLMFPLQLPLTGPLHNEFVTLRA